MRPGKDEFKSLYLPPDNWFLSEEIIYHFNLLISFTGQESASVNCPVASCRMLYPNAVVMKRRDRDRRSMIRNFSQKLLFFG